MKRVFWLVIAGAAVAVVGWYAIGLVTTTSTEAVAALLPRDTIFLLHVPDINRTRDRWHHSDIYELYREPAVQDFLRKPMSRIPKKGAVSQTLHDLEQLDLKDGFFALTSVDQTSPRCVAGFRFNGSEQDAERVIAKWRANLLEKNPGAQREAIEYERRKIDIVTISPFTIASAYDGHWFFVANDQADLKAMLDRADKRTKARDPNLDADESYQAATAHMPSTYSFLFYLQPKIFAQQLQSLRAAIGSPVSPNERTLLEQIHSLCGAARFDAGKIHDVLFVGMPKLVQTPALTRSSIALTTKDTFFYSAAVLNLGKRIDSLAQAPGISDRIQKLFQIFADSGITADDWKAAFGLEVGSLADWPPTSHWPALLVTLPVRDVSKAEKIVEAAMRADEDSFWARTERDGVRYFSMQSPASLIAIAPTIALSDRIMVAGLNAEAVELAIGRSRTPGSELSGEQAYKAASRLVPPPANFFAYFDTGLVYTRLDTTVRPLILMAAAFMPGVNDYVDLDKFPGPEAITKHLSPIVSSQRYERDGYLAESAGPITLNQAAVGLGILALGIANDAKALGGWPQGLPILPQATPKQTP